MVNSTLLILATPHSRHDHLERALAHRMCLTVRRIRTPEELEALTRENTDASHIFFPHWPWRIPEDTLKRFECVVFHMTDLPFGRGGSPLQNLIVRGIYETQLTALRAVDEIDAGPIYLKRPLSLHGSAEEIFLRSADLMLEMILTIWHERPQPIPQIGEPVIFKRRTPADSDISGLTELRQVFDYIRMLDAEGYPPAFIETGNLRLEFSRASLKPDAVLADVRITKRNI